MKRVIVNEGGPFSTSDENAIYVCAGAVEVIEIMVDEELRGKARFVRFTPINGRYSGWETHVPYERPVAIMEKVK